MSDAERETAPLTARHHLEYACRRSVGPALGRLFGALRERRIEGIRTARGRVLVPPTEYDLETGEPRREDFVSVGPSGTVTGAAAAAWRAAARLFPPG